ncbi:hypothetical protein INT45_002357 [Circinella minor]|uniref:Uncharacterized protein n=1 Tax=Circinella minor TaxID=1195481 RepID=A0A8H7S0C1_9FUNG|nr:hypothetical protein INT45_002357 [Circinella minor]
MIIGVGKTRKETKAGLTKNVLNSMKRIGDEEERICQKKIKFTCRRLEHQTDINMQQLNSSTDTLLAVHTMSILNMVPPTTQDTMDDEVTFLPGEMNLKSFDDLDMEYKADGVGFFKNHEVLLLETSGAYGTTVGLWPLVGQHWKISAQLIGFY